MQIGKTDQRGGLPAVRGQPRATPPGPPQDASVRLRLTLKQVEVFVATARSGSTRAAADRVARSQSAASTALADLEAVLETQLFDRLGRRLVLNENGLAFLPRAQALLEAAESAQALFTTEHAAPLRLAASFTIGEHLLPELIARWTALHPACRVQLRIANTREVIDAVTSPQADLGFIEGPQSHPEVRVRPWLMDDMVVVAAPGHPLAAGVATRRQLADATWVLREPGSGTRQVTDSWLTEHLQHVNVGFELGSTEAIKQVVAAGAGLGCLSRHAVAQALADGHLMALRTRLPAARRRLATVVHRDRQLGSTTHDFLLHCQAPA
jgi:DNA-binding transcriptional LysR family regulator